MAASDAPPNNYGLKGCRLGQYRRFGFLTVKAPNDRIRVVWTKPGTYLLQTQGPGLTGNFKTIGLFRDEKEALKALAKHGRG